MAMQVSSRPRDDLDAYYHQYMYRRDDESRRSTGSIYESNEIPVRNRHQGMHFRSNSDTSEINVSLHKDFDIPTETRSPTGESFFALVRKFEKNINDHSNHVYIDGRGTIPPHQGPPFKDGVHSQMPPYKGLSELSAGAPTVEKRTPVLKRKNSIKSNTSIFSMLKSSGTSRSSDDGSILDRLQNRKAISHYDCQSLSLDFEEIAKARARHNEERGRKNTRSGASAASSRLNSVNKTGSRGSDSSVESADEAIDYGDMKTSDLVLSCAYFRNELGGEYESDPQIGLSRDNTAFQNPHDPSRPKDLKIDRIQKRRSTLDILLTAYDSARRGNLSSGTGVTVLDNSKSDSGVPLFFGEGAISPEEGKVVFEHVDHGAFYYRNFFFGQDHQNYLGIDDKFGPVAISLRREKLDHHTSLVKHEADSSHGTRYQYRVIVRTSELTTLRCSVMEECIPSTARHGTARSLPTKDILEYVASDLQLNALKLAQPGPKVPEQLMKLDEQGLTSQYKVGIIYCKANQNTEEEMYNNQSGGPAFDEFLDLIGKRVVLKGFEGYRAQLDNKNDSTGKYSCYTKFHGREIMFHVSTLLPWTPNNKQQLLRKRHIGNDIVTIVFQEPGALPFTPKNIRSHFQHVFIVIQVFNPCSENTYYKVAVSRSKDVPPFGPPIPLGAKFGKQKAFANFLLTKVINAENAAHKSEKFSAMATRTRLEYLRDLATNFITGTTLETGGKAFGKFLGSTKKKEKLNPGLIPEKVYRGALQWNVQVEDYRSSHMIECIMGISADTLVLIDCSSKEALFSISTKAVVGWTPLSQSIKVFYGGGDCLILNIPSSDTDDIPEIVRRLEAVTIGCQTQTLVLRRNPLGQLGFHVQSEGLVADVEPAGLAYQAGLRIGCRLVEINSLVVATVSHEQMIDILRKPGSVSAVVIPPMSSGKPRKGVQQSNHWWSSRSSGTAVSPFGSTNSVNEEHEPYDQHVVEIPPRKTSSLRLGPKPYSKVKENPWIMRANEASDKEISLYNQRASAPNSRTSSNSARSTPTSSMSSVGGSAPNLHEISTPTYGASYTVTSVVAAPHTHDSQASVSQWSKPSTIAHATHVASSTQEVYINGKNKWTGAVNVDLNIKDATKQPATSNSSLSTTGTLHPATSPTTPVSPDTPLFGSTSQRHDHRFRRVLIDDHGDPVVVEEEMKRGSGEIRVLLKDEPINFRIPNTFEHVQTNWQRSNRQEPTDERSGRYTSMDWRLQGGRVKGDISDSEKSNISDRSGSLDRNVSSRVSAGQETPRQKSEHLDDGDVGEKPRLPYKETSLGAIVTTVETYKQSFDEGETALSENIVDQIEKAFGFKSAQVIEAPVIVTHSNEEDEDKRTSSMKKSRSESISLKEEKESSRLSASENSLNRHSSTDERNDSSKEELSKDKERGIMLTPIDKDRSTTVAVGETPEGLTISVRKRDRELNSPALQSDATSQHQTTTAEPGRKGKDIDPRIAARKVLIERLESNRHAMEHNGIEGVRIYHTKSRSTPVVMDKLDTTNRHASSQEDLSVKRLPSHRRGSDQSGSSPRRKKSETTHSHTPSTGRSSKPVVRSERKIKLTQSHAAFSTNGPASGSQTVPRYRSSRRSRHVAKQQSMETDSDEETNRRLRSREKIQEKATNYSSHTVPGHRTYTPDPSKKSASLPRDLGSNASRHAESRSYHQSTAARTKGARIAKIKLNSGEDPTESIVDQTTKLLSAASSKDTSYDMASSLVIAEDVLNSLTRTSALLKNQVSSKEEKEKERKERHASKIKSSGRGRSHGPHKFHIPVVPRRHSFDERIFAQTSGRGGQSGESTLTRESIGREAELEMKLAIVSNALMKEGEERQRCESELRKCQKENRRLQEELRTASAQLRKFTEWFFASVEQHNT